MNGYINQKQAMRAKKQNIVVFCIYAGIALILIAALCISRYSHTYSKSRWDSDIGNRYKIVSDMLEKNSITGMSEKEVIALLGNEDNNDQTTFKISKTYFPPETTLVYYLGVDHMDDNWLVISFTDGIATGYYLDVT